MSQLNVSYITATVLLCFCGLGMWHGMSVGVVDGYRDDSRILKWSPAWLSTTDPAGYSVTRSRTRPMPIRGFYYRRLRDEEGPVKWSPWYLSKGGEGGYAKRSPSAWDGGDNYASAGSPEWFRDDELLN